MTMLFRLKGQAGLEILTPENTWVPVPVCPPGTENDPAPPILLNIGDLLSYWTNGLLRSTVHRVVFPGPGKGKVDGETATEPRYSIAFFCHPVSSTPLLPVPSERVRNFVPKGQEGSGNPYAERKVMTADEHLQMRCVTDQPLLVCVLSSSRLVHVVSFFLHRRKISPQAALANQKIG